MKVQGPDYGSRVLVGPRHLKIFTDKIFKGSIASIYIIVGPLLTYFGYISLVFEFCKPLFIAGPRHCLFCFMINPALILDTIALVLSRSKTILSNLQILLVIFDESFHSFLFLLFRQLFMFSRLLFVDLRLRETILRNRVHVPRFQLKNKTKCKDLST
jgi:hypothetical protein